MSALAMKACLLLEQDARDYLLSYEKHTGDENWYLRWGRTLPSAQAVIAACDEYHAAQQPDPPDISREEQEREKRNIETVMQVAAKGHQP